MSHRNALAVPEDVKGFHLEGSGATAFPRGRMRPESFRRRDEHPPPGGKIGFRRTAPLIGEYADLKVTSP